MLLVRVWFVQGSLGWLPPGLHVAVGFAALFGGWLCGLCWGCFPLFFSLSCVVFAALGLPAGPVLWVSVVFPPLVGFVLGLLF